MENELSDITTLTDANFAAEVTAFPGVVMIDYWAEWCGPCHAMAPVVSELAKKYAGNPMVKIAKLNIEENPDETAKSGVLSIPNFKFFTEGSIKDPRADQVVGVSPVEELEAVLDRLLATLPKTKPAA